MLFRSRTHDAIKAAVSDYRQRAGTTAESAACAPVTPAAAH